MVRTDGTESAQASSSGWPYPSLRAMSPHLSVRRSHALRARLLAIRRRASEPVTESQVHDSQDESNRTNNEMILGQPSQRLKLVRLSSTTGGTLRARLTKLDLSCVPPLNLRT